MKNILALLFLITVTGANADTVNSKCTVFLTTLLDQVDRAEKVNLRTAVPVECQYYHAKELDSKLFGRISNAYRDHRRSFNDSAKLMTIIADLNSFVSPPKVDSLALKSETAKCEAGLNYLNKMKGRLEFEINKAASSNECAALLIKFTEDNRETSQDCKGQLFVMTSRDFKEFFKSDIEPHLGESVDKESLNTIYSGFRSAIIKQTKEKCKRKKLN